MKRFLRGNRGNNLIKVPGSIQPHGALLVARQSDLRVLYVSENAEKVTQIPVSAMLGMSLLNCLSAEVGAEIIEGESRKHNASRQPRTQALAGGVGTRHHFDIFHHDGLVYVEVELAPVAPEPERLRVCDKLLA